MEGGQAAAKEFSVWKAVVFSFFSKALYQDVWKNWKGVGFAYLFLVLVFVSVPRAVRIHGLVGKEVAKGSKDFFKEIPAFKIEKGVFSVAVKQPYYSPNRSKPVVVIDTTGKINSLTQVSWDEKAESVMLVTADKLMMRQMRLGVPDEKMFEFSQLGSLAVNNQKLEEWTQGFAKWAGFLVYPFVVLGYFVYGIVAMMFYGLIGLGIARLLKLTLNYESAMRLSAVSHTPAMLLAAVLFFLGVDMPAGFFVFLAISTAFLFFSIKSNAAAVPPLVPR